MRYLLGCSSVHGLDIQQGHAIYEALKKSHLAPEAFQTTPHFETQLPFMDWESVTPKIPKLLRCYLGLGAKICGRPSMDESFGTIDFLTLLDLKDLSLNISNAFWGRKRPRNTICFSSDNRKGILKSSPGQPSDSFLVVGCRQSFE